MFVDSEDVQKQKLSQTQQELALKTFLRGEYPDMLSKAKVLDPDYEPLSLRFLREIEQAACKDTDLFSNAEAAQKQSQMAQLDLIRVNLQSERLRFLNAKASIEEYNEKLQLVSVESKEQWQTALDTAIVGHLDALCRVDAMLRGSAANSGANARLRPQWFAFHEGALRRAAEEPLPEGNAPSLGNPDTTLRVNILSASATQLHMFLINRFSNVQLLFFFCAQMTGSWTTTQSVVARFAARFGHRSLFIPRDVRWCDDLAQHPNL